MTHIVSIFWLLCLLGCTLVAVSVNFGRSDDSLRLVGFEKTGELEYSSNVIWGQFMPPNNSSSFPECMRVYVDFCFLKDCSDTSIGWIKICAMHTHPCRDIVCPYNSSVISIFRCTCDEKEHISVDISRGPREIMRNAAMRFRLASSTEPNSADVKVSRTFEIENELMDLVASSLTLEFLGFEQHCEDCYEESVVYATCRVHQTVLGFNETYRLFVDVCITGNCKKSGSSWMSACHMQSFHTKNIQCPHVDHNGMFKCSCDWDYSIIVIDMSKVGGTVYKTASLQLRIAKTALSLTEENVLKRSEIFDVAQSLRTISHNKTILQIIGFKNINTVSAIFEGNNDYGVHTDCYRLVVDTCFQKTCSDAPGMWNTFCQLQTFPCKMKTCRDLNSTSSSSCRCSDTSPEVEINITSLTPQKLTSGFIRLRLTQMKRPALTSYDLKIGESFDFVRALKDYALTLVKMEILDVQVCVRCSELTNLFVTFEAKPSHRDFIECLKLYVDICIYSCQETSGFWKEYCQIQTELCENTTCGSLNKTSMECYCSTDGSTISIDISRTTKHDWRGSFLRLRLSSEDDPHDTKSIVKLSNIFNMGEAVSRRRSSSIYNGCQILIADVWMVVVTKFLIVLVTQVLL